MNVTGIVFDIKRFALHDGPGTRTTVFLKGCPLRCLWCQNPESFETKRELFHADTLCTACQACAAVCPEHAITFVDNLREYDPERCVLCGACARACPADALTLSGSEMDVDEVLGVVLRDKPFYETSGGGMTISGGEPLMQADFTAALLHGAHEQGVHTTLDTSGFASWTTFERILPSTDLILLDLKLADEERHRAATGVTNKPIVENARKLGNGGTPLIVRIPLIPGVNDDTDNIIALAALLAELDALEHVDVLPFNRLARSKYTRLGKAYHFDATPPTVNVEAIAEQLADKSGKAIKILRGLGVD